MLESISKISDKIDLLAKSVAIILVAAITLIMLLQVFFRYVLNSSLQWSEELMLMNLTWVVFLGGIVLMRNWEHANIPTFINLIPEKFRPFIFILAKLLTIIFLLIIVWYGFDVFNQTFHAKSPSLKISTRWAKLAIPVCGVFMTFLALNAMLQDLLALVRKDKSYFKNLGDPHATE